MMIENDPFAPFKDPEKIKEEVAKAKQWAEFFRSHWIAFYLTVGIGLWRAYESRKLTDFLKRLEKSLTPQLKNPKRKKHGRK